MLIEWSRILHQIILKLLAALPPTLDQLVCLIWLLPHLQGAIYYALAPRQAWAKIYDGPVLWTPFSVLTVHICHLGISSISSPSHVIEYTNIYLSKPKYTNRVDEVRFFTF